VTIVRVVLLMSDRAGLTKRVLCERESQEAAEWSRRGMATTDREAAEAAGRDEA
jgi:hypothetical protein